MKRVQKKAVVLCLLLSLVLSLAACGAPETGGGAGGPAAESKEAGETGTESVRDEETGAEEALRMVAVRRNALLKGGEPDLKRAVSFVLDDFRSGKLGRITLDRL